MPITPDVSSNTSFHTSHTFLATPLPTAISTTSFTISMSFISTFCRSCDLGRCQRFISIDFASLAGWISFFYSTVACSFFCSAQTSSFSLGANFLFLLGLHLRPAFFQRRVLSFFFFETSSTVFTALSYEGQHNLAVISRDSGGTTQRWVHQLVRTLMVATCCYLGLQVSRRGMFRFRRS